MPAFEVCNSYDPKSLVCRDGFVQKPICSGNFGCPHCGQHGDEATPWCQREDIPAHWLSEDGKPTFHGLSKDTPNGQ